MKNILIIDDDVKTSSKYKKWLECEEGFKMSVMDGFNLYDKLHNISKKVEHTPKQFRVCFMTSSIINYKVLAEIHPEIGKECYVSKEVPKEVFIKHVHSLIS